MADFFIPEHDITKTQADGVQVLLAPAGIPIPMAEAERRGLVRRAAPVGPQEVKESEPTAPVGVPDGEMLDPATPPDGEPLTPDGSPPAPKTGKRPSKLLDPVAAEDK